MPSCSLTPHSQTILRAMSVAIFMSPASRVVTSPTSISSPTRPPIFTARLAGDYRKTDTFREFHCLRVHPQNFFASFHIGKIDRDLSIETSRTQQRRIENIGTVGRGDDDDTFLRVEAVHLDQQCIQRLLALVVSAANTVTAMTADSVDFVDENDAGRGFLALLEHIADAARADADKHFHEIGAADGEARNVGFAGDRAGEQSFAGARRADQQYAFRNSAAE